MKNQLVVAINGMARSGKDTFAESSINLFNTNDLAGENFSSVDKVKELLGIMGWDGEKDDKSRKALSDLKDLWTEYNDGPFNEILKKITESKAKIIFVHIREVPEIEKLKHWCNDNSIFFESIRVIRDSVKQITNNTGDNGSLEEYDYTHTMYNNSSELDWIIAAGVRAELWIMHYNLLD